MSNETATPAPVAPATPMVQSKSISLMEILGMTLRRWPWLLLSLFVCLCIAKYYLLSTPKVYTREAELMIKDDTSGRSSAADAFSDFGIFTQNANISNEVANLTSKDLMEDVVRRLRLDVDYYTKGRFHKNVVYGISLPFNIHFIDLPADQSAYFDLTLHKNGTIKLSDFRLKFPNESKAKKFKESFETRVNDTVKTPAGKIVIVPTNYYNSTMTTLASEDNADEIEYYIAKKTITSAAATCVSRLKVDAPKDLGTVLKIYYSDQSIQRADDILSTLIGIYNESWIRDKNQIAVSTSNFINDRLNIIESELGKVDNDISSYKSVNLIPDVNAVSSIYLSENQKISSELLELNNQLTMTRYIRSYLAGDSNHDNMLPSNSGINNQDIQAQIVAYNNKILERNALISKSSYNNPLVKTIDDQLATLRNSIIGSVDNHIISLNTQIKNLQRSEAQTTSRIASNPSQAKYLLSVERQQKVKESLYIYLLQKREENELSQAFTAYNTRIVNKPGASNIPTTPNSRNVYLMAILIGFVIPFAIIYLIEFTNTKIRGSKDLEDMQTPLIGEIPLQNSEKKKFKLPFKKEKENYDAATPLVVENHNRDIINEAFRVLRTNIDFMSRNIKDGNVIAVTSFNPHSGKSFISLNVGAALALKDKKVLLIDGDMRHGSTSKHVDSPKHGLSSYLSSETNDFNSLIVPDKACPNLYILPVGMLPPNPAELLESPRLGEMLEKLKGEYDYIIFDCPPIDIVADTQIIERHVGRTLFVVRVGMLDKRMVKEIDKIRQENKYNNIGVILNGTILADNAYNSRYGYHYGYRYGQGYGYGYGYGNHNGDASDNK